MSFRNKRVGGVDYESGKDFALLTEEITLVHRTMYTQSGLAKFRIIIRDHIWDSMKDNVLREALRYRFENDVRYIKGVTAAKKLGKYLLYTNKAGTELGGSRNTSSKKIVGENKVGRYIMELANFNFSKIDDKNK